MVVPDSRCVRGAGFVSQTVKSLFGLRPDAPPLITL